jgi:hypothetical protein
MPFLSCDLWANRKQGKSKQRQMHKTLVRKQSRWHRICKKLTVKDDRWVWKIVLPCIKLVDNWGKSESKQIQVRTIWYKPGGAGELN